VEGQRSEFDITWINLEAPYETCVKRIQDQERAELANAKTADDKRRAKAKAKARLALLDKTYLNDDEEA
jgi:hypothetical protein